MNYIYYKLMITRIVDNLHQNHFLVGFHMISFQLLIKLIIVLLQDKAKLEFLRITVISYLSHHNYKNIAIQYPINTKL